MASTVTPHTDMDPSPRVDVFIDDADLDGDTVTITVHQISVAGDIEVRNMTNVSSVGGFFETDFEVPLGVPVTYKVQQYDTDGVELGFVLELATQVDTDPRFAVLSDPLAPGDAVAVRMEARFAGSLTRSRPSKTYYAGPRTVTLSGLQSLLRDVPLQMWTDNVADRDAFERVVASSVLLVRTTPNLPLPQLFFASVPTVTQTPFDYHQGGTTDVWDLTGTEVSRPTIDVIVAVISYQRFIDYMAAQPSNTYADAAAIWSTYLDALMNPPAEA